MKQLKVTEEKHHWMQSIHERHGSLAGLGKINSSAVHMTPSFADDLQVKHLVSVEEVEA
ncbi:MAG: hypothetical protein ACLT0Y_03055 [Christensenellales bacterium]